MNTSSNQHYIIRCGDGKNFLNSNYPYWGVKRGKNNCIKSMVKKFKSGDILWFITNKNSGGRIIGMAEYINFYDRQDETLVNINTFSNEEMGWDGNNEWDIQINYCNLFHTIKQDIKIIISCGAIILKYDTWRERLPDLDLIKHYNNYIFYSQPSKYSKN